MHAISQPIIQLHQNLDLLRDFSNVVVELLDKRNRETYETHETILLSLFLALDRMNEINADFKTKSLTDQEREQIQGRIQGAKIELDENNKSVCVKFTGPQPNAHKLKAAVTEILHAQQRVNLLYSSGIISLTSSLELFFFNCASHLLYHTSWGYQLKRQTFQLR